MAEIATSWMIAASIFAAIIFLARIVSSSEHASAPVPTIEGARPPLPFALLFLIMAFIANAAYAAIHLSELHYRTHILSRVWASAAIGILVGYAFARRGALRVIGCVVATLFIFFGTWGGMERQDLYLGTWRQHQRELASILNTAPALRAGTSVILRSGPAPRFLATEADYLASLWLRMLYDDPKMLVLRLTPERGTFCKTSASGLDCLGERSVKKHFDYGHLIVMDYDNDSGTYQLVRSLNDPRYQPERLIIRRPWTLRQRRLLLLTK